MELYMHSTPLIHHSPSLKPNIVEKLARVIQVAMEDLSMPKGQEILQDLSETYETISRSRAVQDKAFPTIRKSQSAGSGISRIEDDTTVNFRRRDNFERKLELQSYDRSTHHSGYVDVCIHSGPGDSSERKQAIADLELLNSISSTAFFSSEISEISTKTQNKDDAKGHLIHLKISVNKASWTKVQTEVAFPISLKFSDIRYNGTLVGRSAEMNTCILHGVTGSVNPGEFLALMGPSGGGKTTLLNLLGGRIKIEEHSGSITYNDQPYSKLLKGRIGFVHQDDIVFPHLTVRETLTYAARLRLPGTLTKQQKEERAVQVIAELGLETCQDAMIGGEYIRGISGGERKRVCIGNEILLDPSLLFLDEPTSGVDSTTAIRIAQVLQSIAQAGRTVVTTIHQPSSRLFNMFDKLIILGKGSSLFFGKTSEAMLYFSSIGCSPLITMNPAEFLVDIANGNMNDISIPLNLTEIESKYQERPPSSVDIHKYLVGAYENRMEQREMQKLLEPAMMDRKCAMQNCCTSEEEIRIGWWEQHHILFCRGLKERRLDHLNCIRVIQVVSTAVIIGLLWWRSDPSTPKRLQDQAGLLFFISVFWGYFPVFTAIFAFPQERAMLIKERSVDMYKLSAYFIARNMSDIPLELILPAVFLLIVYFMVGLKLVFTVFLQTMLIIFLSVVAAQGLGLAIGVATMDIKQATQVASVIITTFMLAGGFFMQKAPSFTTWIRYLSFNYHTYRLLLKTQYGCQHPYRSKFSACDSPFIKELELGRGYVELGALLANIFGYRLIAYFFLRRMKLRNVT